MALDAGTTSCRCILFDKAGNIISLAQKEFTQIYPKAAWVEHDPMEIWAGQIGVCREAMSKIGAKAENIAAIGITNQRETTIVWDKDSGKPVYNAIVWQCRRTADLCDDLIKRGYTDMVRKKTGLLIDPYFSASKIAWILDNVEGARKKAEEGRLLFGTVETWLIWNLTGGRVHVTDYSNASRTMLFNIHTLKWDKELMELFDIPVSMMPEPKPSSHIYGYSDPCLLGGEIPVSGAAGDQQCALFGQTCFEKGDAKNTYGTGCFLLMNTGEKALTSSHGLVTTIAWGLGEKVSYALEGSVFIAGAVIQWLRDELKIIEKASDSEALAKSVPDTNGVYLVPAFVGLGAPYWDPHARGTICGLTRGSRREHIVRAALESMAYQSFDVLKAMEDDLGSEIRSLKVDGGASANDFLMQFQSDIMGCRVQRPVCIETTALGAAYFAGLATEYWESFDDIKNNWQTGKEYLPQMEEGEARIRLSGWHKAVESARISAGSIQAVRT